MASNGPPKTWGKGEFWGLGTDYDHDWILTVEQKALREKVIELCRIKIRPHAIHCDRTYTYPRESMNALAELGLLGSIVPKELGGLGLNHVGAAMIVETIARYGCPSTAMVYTMHLGAVATVLFRYHNSKILQNLLRRLDKDKLIGTLSYSDPATGGHYWFPLSSKVEMVDKDNIKILKYGSWATSSGCADWYTVQTVSPKFDGDYSNLSCFLVFKEHVRASTDDWKSLGMHGNQSGPLIIDGTIPIERLIGPIGDGRLSNDECEDPYFLLLTSSVWNGISLACIDLAKRHVTRKAHGDVGIRVCDYPTIQDYFGESVALTSTSRSHVFLIASMMDKATNDNDWSLHSDLKFLPRTDYLHWLWIAKFVAAKNVNTVTDTMLHSCGGSGYKTEFGLERLLRDGKAACVMGPSNEVLRQFIGKTALMGLEIVDYWEQNCNERVLHHELGKMSLGDKKVLAHKLLQEVRQEESGVKASHPLQDTDFDNPFNVCPPRYASQAIETSEGITHKAALNPKHYKQLVLAYRKDISANMSAFVFSLPNETDHTGCLPGQFIQVRISSDGQAHERFLSPVSSPTDFGRIEIVLRFETQGIVSNYFKSLDPGAKVEFRGPCGGFEYESNQLDELTLIASCGGITPGMQLIRCILGNPSDKTKIKLIYYSDSYDDILFRKELYYLAAKDERLKIVYTLGEVPESWDEEEGFIDTELLEKHVTKPNSIKHKIVMCGGPTMVISCLHSLRTLKFPSEMVFVYGQFGTEQVRTVYGRNVRLSGHKCKNNF